MAELNAVPEAVAGMTALCRVADVPQGTGLRVEIAGREAVAVFRVGSEYFVTDDKCTHGNGSLADGELVDDEIECPFHFGRFCVRDGRAAAPPCVVPIRTYRCEVLNGQIYIALPTTC